MFRGQLHRACAMRNHDAAFRRNPNGSEDLLTMGVRHVEAVEAHDRLNAREVRFPDAQELRNIGHRINAKHQAFGEGVMILVERATRGEDDEIFQGHAVGSPCWSSKLRARINASALQVTQNYQKGSGPDSFRVACYSAASWISPSSSS